MRWLLSVSMLLGLALAVGVSSAPATADLITVHVTTDDSMPPNLDAFEVCPCDGEEQPLTFWAKSDTGHYIRQWTVGFGIGLEEIGDDISAARTMKLGHHWTDEVEGAAYSAQPDGILWNATTNAGYIGTDWVFLGQAYPIVAEVCDRGNETNTDARGYFVRWNPPNFIPSTFGPEDPVRELTPDCDSSPYVVCPARRAYCWGAETCGGAYPERESTCGECGTNPDCGPHEQCCCGVCELGECCFDFECHNYEVCVQNECVIRRGCEDDEDCDEPFPYCVGGACKECRYSFHCGPGKGCVDGVCEFVAE